MTRVVPWPEIGKLESLIKDDGFNMGHISLEVSGGDVLMDVFVNQLKTWPDL